LARRNDPEIKILKEKKLANFTLATNELQNDKRKSGGNAMASISRLGKAADIMEKFVTKGDRREVNTQEL
jgi:single-stranded DNA-binding protein